MKTRTWLPIVVAIQILSGLCLSAAEQMTALHARPGSKMRIEGTSTLGDWQAENKIIGGSIEVGPNFPLTPGQEVKPEKINIRGTARIAVRSLQSIEKNGSHKSHIMDESMWAKLSITNHPYIFYYPKEMTLKEAPKSKDAPYLFDAKGDIVVGGVTNTVSMPVTVLPMPDSKVKISGKLETKMSNFNIEPKYLAGKVFTTANEITLIYDWVLAPAKPAAAAATK
jgi:hypothetical protein